MNFDPLCTNSNIKKSQCLMLYPSPVLPSPLLIILPWAYSSMNYRVIQFNATKGLGKAFHTGAWMHHPDTVVRGSSSLWWRVFFLTSIVGQRSNRNQYLWVGKIFGTSRSPIQGGRQFLKMTVGPNGEKGYLIYIYPSTEENTVWIPPDTTG